MGVPAVDFTINERDGILEKIKMADYLPFYFTMPFITILKAISHNTCMKKHTAYFVVLLASWMLACRMRNVEQKESNVQPIQNNGVLIDYTDSKRGDTTLMFIHGWGINKTYWNEQVAHFSKRYRVITIDLPGFGNSGKNRKDWTAEAYSKDILTVIRALKARRVILVGHSMSGAIVIETAQLSKDTIVGIVGVDNLKTMGMELSPETLKEWSTFYATVRKAYQQTISKDIQQLFSNTTEPAIRERVTKDILQADSSIAVDVLQNMDMYPFGEKLKHLNKTIYLINSDYTPTDTTAFIRQHIRYCLLNIGTTGHYPMLEKPAAFDSLLQVAIDQIGRTRN